MTDLWRVSCGVRVASAPSARPARSLARPSLARMEDAEPQQDARGTAGVLKVAAVLQNRANEVRAAPGARAGACDALARPCV